MSMKLTNEIRNKILANIVADHAVSAEARTVIDRSHALAMQVLSLAYPKGVTNNAEMDEWYQAERKRTDTESMLSTNYYLNYVTVYRDRDRKTIGIRSDKFGVNAGGHARELFLSGDYHDQEGRTFDDFSPWMGPIVPGYALSKMKGLLQYDESGALQRFFLPYSRVTLKGPALLDELDALDQMRREVWEKYITLRSVVWATLSKYNSDSKLIEAWPEVKPFIPAEQKKTGTAVALDTATLNAICGLPK
jgi:hypothetical protein